MVCVNNPQEQNKVFASLIYRYVLYGYAHNSHVILKYPNLFHSELSVAYKTVEQNALWKRGKIHSAVCNIPS